MLKAHLKYPPLLTEQEELFIELKELNNSDEEDSAGHSKLIEAISQLDKTGIKKRLRIAQRTEPISKINEHALAHVRRTRSSNKIEVEDLLQTIEHKPTLAQLPKAIKKAQDNAQTLDAPLEKHEAIKIERAAGYEKVKGELRKWDPVVKSNRTAEQLIFPLSQPSLKVIGYRTKNFTEKFKPTTPLEQQISELLKGSKHVQDEDQELTQAETEALSSMSLQEALERRKELARSRALQSYQEAKARRQNKIKSKTYHRLLKKEKMKKHIKDFEDLKDHNPEGALEKLKQLENKRIEERMTLKHKGSGKWAKLQAIRAKYDENAREAIAEQLRIGKEVTRKVKKSDDESEDDIPVAQSVKSDNPWLGGSAATSTAPREITSGYRKLWNNVNESKKKRQEIESESPEQKETSFSEKDGEEDEGTITQATTDADEMQNKFSEELDEGLLRKTTLEDFSDMPEVTKKIKSKIPKTKSDKEEIVSQSSKTGQWKIETSSNIDPNKYVTMTTAVHLKSSVPITEEAGEEEDEEEQIANQRRMTLAEAFADDDVVDQFDEEKKRIIESNNPKDIDLTLPGWGDWGGSGLKISKRKKKLFTIKAPEGPKRRDHNRRHLIINEDKCPALRRQQVDNLPHYFKSAAAFESSIRAPVTSTFIPQTAACKLAAPNVVRKIGGIIEPISKETISGTAERELPAREAKKRKTGNVYTTIKSNNPDKEKRLKK